MTICLAYAPTDPGRAALRHCVHEARVRGCDVVVVNATRQWDDVTPVPLTEEEHAELRGAFEAAGLAWGWHDARVEGLSAADEILTAIEGRDVGLVVIGVTDRAHVEKRIVSDTTRHVLLDAPCEVLAVRAEHQVSPA